MGYASKIYQSSNLPEPFEEEKQMQKFAEMKKGNEEAKNELREHNLQLVVSTINEKFGSLINSHPLLDIDDLISIGVLGLIKGIDGFKPEKGYKFSTYAVPCIENEVRKALRKIKVGFELKSLEAVATTKEETEDLFLYEVIGSGQCIEDDYLRKERLEEMKRILDSLEEIEREVIIKKYGLEGEQWGQKALAQKLNTSQPTISRIERKAKEKLARRINREQRIDVEASVPRLKKMR